MSDPPGSASGEHQVVRDPDFPPREQIYLCRTVGRCHHFHAARCRRLRRHPVAHGT